MSAPKKVGYEVSSDEDFRCQYWNIKNLAAGMLKRAILDLQEGISTIDKKHTKSALNWFTCPGRGGLTFAWCCSVLDLDEKKQLEKIAKLFPAVKGRLLFGSQSKSKNYLCNSDNSRFSEQNNSHHSEHVK